MTAPNLLEKIINLFLAFVKPRLLCYAWVTFMRKSFLIVCLSLFWAYGLQASNPVARDPVRRADNVILLSNNHYENHELLSIPKEDLSNSFSHQKVKSLVPLCWKSGLLSYSVFSYFSHHVTSKTYDLGGTNGLRAPPVFTLS